MSTAIVKKPTFNFDKPSPDGITGLQKMAADPMISTQIAAALPRMLAGSAPRMVRCLLTECSRNAILLDCTPKSLFGAVVQAAQLGLEVGGPAGQCYLVPRRDKGIWKANLQVGYRGFLTLAHRSGQVRRFAPRLVRAGDKFGIEYGTDQKLVHVPNMDALDAPVTGYYAAVELVNGGHDFEYRTLRQIEEHRDKYASSRDFWAKNFDEGGKKTCVLYLAKRVPLSVEWQRAAGIELEAEAGIEQNLDAMLELPAPDKLAEMRERVEAAKAPPPDDGTGEPPA